MIEKAEESTDTSSLLTAGEAKDLTEILDKVRVSLDVPHHALNLRRPGHVFRERW